MCDKAVDNYPDALEFVLECFKAQKMSDKAVNTYLSTTEYLRLKKRVIKSLINVLLCLILPIQDSKMCNKIVSDDPFKLKYCHDRYKAQEMYNKTVDDFLPALKFVPDGFVKSKKIEKLLTALYADENMLSFNEDSGDVAFPCGHC